MKRLFTLVIVIAFHGNLLGQTGGYVKYVNPLIGTQKMGHTFPGATVLFGSAMASTAFLTTDKITGNTCRCPFD